MIFDAPVGLLNWVAQAFFFYKELQPRRRMAAERNAAAGADQKLLAELASTAELEIMCKSAEIFH